MEYITQLGSGVTPEDSPANLQIFMQCANIFDFPSSCVYSPILLNAMELILLAKGPEEWLCPLVKINSASAARQTAGFSKPVVGVSWYAPHSAVNGDK